MTTSNREQISIGALAVNDGVNFEVESLTFNPAQKKPLFASNADADGEALVRESHYTPASFDLLVRVVPQATADAARAKMGELSDAVQSCEKVEGGQEVPWIPHDSETLYTARAITGDVTEVPIEVVGDNAGWFLKAPVVKVHLTCRPFLATAERTILAAVESPAEPLQSAYISGVKGDVPAEGRLIVKDTATQTRRFAAWGRDVVTSEANPALLLSANSGLTGTGFSGESKTRTGAFGAEKVLRAAAVSQGAPICGTGRITNVGSYGVDLRVWATSKAARFRISYRNGDGPLIPLEWKEPTVVNGWSEIFMGEVFLDAVRLGTQTSEVRVEQRVATGAATNDVNYLLLWPTTKASGYARGIANLEATNLIAYDNFEQTTGNLEGKEPNFPSAITWGETNKTGANGFKVNATSHILERTAVSDTNLNSGCFAQLGSTSYTSAYLRVLALQGSPAYEGHTRMGLLARYVSTEKWVIAVVELIGTSTIIEIIKNVSGTLTQLGVGLTGGSVLPSTSALTRDHEILFSVLANGSWVAQCGGAYLTGQDADLAAGGTLASGKVGVYDAYSQATAAIRGFDGFQVMGAEEAGRVCYSGKQLEFNSAGCLRQDSTGTYDGAPSSYRGAGFYLEPAGELGLINRVAVRMRRNDNAVEEDSTVTDKQKIEVLVRERFLLPR